MSKRVYRTRGQWYGGNETAAAVGARFLDTLDRLGPLDPAMNNWLILDKATVSAIPIAKARPGITEQVLKNVSQDDSGEPDPRGGYRLFSRGGASESEIGSPRSVDVEAKVGSHWTNEVMFKIGSDAEADDSSLATYANYRGSVEVLASSWPCPWVECYLLAPDFPPLEPATFPSIPQAPVTQRLSIFRWIVYLSAPLAAGFTPSPELICEHTPGGGMILSAVADRLDPDNPDHARRSRILQEIMEERIGKNSPPNGWANNPPPPRAGPF